METTEQSDLQAIVASRYAILRELGRGGMGIVYLARDIALDRAVAIKLLFPYLARRDDFRARFLLEARIAARLSHPNIVTVYAVEEHDEMVFFVMAYISGETLGTRLEREGRLSPAEAVRLLRDVAWALGYAHGYGVVHRDVKPDNILIDRATRRALLADFGIAAARSNGAASPGEVIGTPHYMSPEQGLGEPVDGRSDLYSLGVVAFHALSGILPFRASNPIAVMRQHVTDQPPSLSKKLPTDLTRLVSQCLAKEAKHRPRSAEVVAEALGASSAVVPETPPEIRLFLRRARIVSQAVIGALVGVYGLWRLRDDIQVTLDPSLLEFLPLLAVGGLVGLGWFLLEPARKVCLGGLGWREVQAALDQEKRRVQQERAVVATRLSPADDPWEHLTMAARDRRNALGPGRFPLLLVGFALVGLGAVVWTLSDAIPVPSVRVLVLFVSLLLFGGGLSAFWVHLHQPGLRIDVHEGLRLIARPYLWKPSLFWEFEIQDFLASLRNTYLRTVLRLGGLGTSLSRTARDEVASEPTEFMLGSEVEKIFLRLPVDTQRRFPDVPGLITRLRESATRIRSNALRDERNGHRIATVTAALDDLRLLLVRLEADSITESELTGNMAQLEEISRHIDAELDARRMARKG